MNVIKFNKQYAPKINPKWDAKSFSSDNVMTWLNDREVEERTHHNEPTL